MHSLGALNIALYCSLLTVFSQGMYKNGAGDFNVASHRSRTSRSSGHHLPTYMMHLYRNFKTNRSYPVDFLEQGSINNADTVRSVIAKSLARRGKRWIVTFDFSSALAEEQLQMAELRIRLPRNTNITNLTVEMYHHHEYPCPGKETCHDQMPVGLLSTSSGVSSSQNWRIYNVTSLLLDWLKLHSASKRRKQANQGPSFSNAARLAGSKGEQSVNDRALLVVFSHVKPEEGSLARASLLHTAEQSKFLFSTESKKIRRPKRHKSNRGPREPPMKNLEVPSKGNMKSMCRKVDLHIDFNQIGWGSWIVFPKKYNAYRCEGMCPNPVGEDFQPTNHAYMQSLLKHYHPDRVPSACCAPTKMSPLSMLYYEGGEVLLRHHEDMIVDECGCH